MKPRLVSRSGQEDSHIDLLKAAPDFFVLNPPRSSSTWLFENLRNHPEVFIPASKEVKYFSSFDKMCDVRWYLESFLSGGTRRKGDVSPSYSILPDEKIQAVKELCPNLRLIFIFRNPVERAWSHVKHQLRLHESVFVSMQEPYERVPTEKLIEAITSPWTLAYSDYLAMMRRWMKAYPKEQIYVDFLEGVVNAPETVLRGVCRHLGVSADFDWTVLPIRERVNVGLEHEVPETVREVALFMMSDRTREFADFLKTEFQLSVPGSWQGLLGTHRQANPWRMPGGDGFEQSTLTDILKRESWQSTHIQVLREEYKGYKIIGFKDDCLAISKSIGHVGILELSRFDVDRLKREGKILCAETLREVIGLIDTIQKDEPFVVRAIQVIDRLIRIEVEHERKGVIIDGLRQELTESQTALETHRQTLETVRNEVVKRHAVLKDRRVDSLAGAAAIEAALKETGSPQGIVEALRRVFAAENVDIEALKRGIEAGEHDINALRQRLALADAASGQVRREVEAQALAIEEMQRSLVGKDRDIDSRARDNESMKTSLQTLRKDLEARNHTIEELQSSLVQRDGEVDRKSREIESTKDSLQTLRNDLAARDERLKDLVTKDAQIGELRVALEEKISVLEGFRRDIDARDEKLRQQGDSIARLEKDLADREGHIGDLGAELEGIKSAHWYRLGRLFRRR